MTFLFKFIIVLGAFGAFTFYLMYEITSFILGTRSVNRAMAKDADLMKEDLQIKANDLVELDTEECSLISTSLTPQKKRKYRSGYVQTIYQEKLFTWAIKTYSNDRFLLVVKSKKDTYSFKMVGQSLKVFKNGQNIGTISIDGVLVCLDGDRIYLTKADSEKSVRTIFRNNQALAYVSAPDKQGRYQLDRYFTLFENKTLKISDGFIAIVLYDLLINRKI